MAHDHRPAAAPQEAAREQRPDQKARRRNEWRRVAGLLPYIWNYKLRVAVALVFLVAAKLANVGVPLTAGAFFTNEFLP